MPAIIYANAPSYSSCVKEGTHTPVFPTSFFCLGIVFLFCIFGGGGNCCLPFEVYVWERGHKLTKTVLAFPKVIFLFFICVFQGIRAHRRLRERHLLPQQPGGGGGFGQGWVERDKAGSATLRVSHVQFRTKFTTLSLKLYFLIAIFSLNYFQGPPSRVPVPLL